MLFPLFVRIRTLDSLNSQTKCNTLLRCCHGTRLYTTHPSAVKWPAYTPRDTLSAKLRQLWIARHRRRELTRNASSTQGYQPGYADQQARARRWQGSKLDRDSTLRDAVLARLQHGWSPQQVAGRLARERQQPVISHETIYRFIYAQIARKKDYSWRHYLPRAKAKRGRRLQRP